MKDRLFFILFVIFALAFVSSKQTNIKQSHYVASSFTLSAGNQYIECVVPEINFSLKKVVTSCLLKFTHYKTFYLFITVNIIHLSYHVSGLHQAEITSIRNVKHKIPLLKFFTPTGKEDYHHLS